MVGKRQVGWPCAYRCKPGIRAIFFFLFESEQGSVAMLVLLGLTVARVRWQDQQQMWPLKSPPSSRISPRAQNHWGSVPRLRTQQILDACAD